VGVGKLALLAVLVVSLGRLAAGAPSSSVSESELVIIGLRPSRLLGVSLLGVLELYLHLLFLVDVVSTRFCVCSQVWIGAWPSRLTKSAVHCARAEGGGCPRRVLLVRVHSSRRRGPLLLCDCLRVAQLAARRAQRPRGSMLITASAAPSSRP
jgi:hypothetical protein